MYRLILLYSYHVLLSAPLMRLRQLQQLPAHDLKVIDLLAWLEAVALLIRVWRLSKLWFFDSALLESLIEGDRFLAAGERALADGD